MSKYKEALYEIERELYFDCGIGMDGYNKEKELKLIKELVDKETPMKPVKNDKLSHDQFSDLCPVCGKTLLYKSAGCHNNECRQRIDWSIDDE